MNTPADKPNAGSERTINDDGQSHEQRMYDTLKRIAKGYRKPDWFERNSEKAYGLPPADALEMAYENIQAEATLAVRGMRRPK